MEGYIQNICKEDASLEQIIVTPLENCDTKQPDESMCSSYRHKKKQDLRKNLKPYIF